MSRSWCVHSLVIKSLIELLLKHDSSGKRVEDPRFEYKNIIL